MPVTWDDTKEKQLLLLILHLTQPAPPWTQVAEGMGDGCSEEACKQKLKKLKMAAKEQFGEPPASANGAPKNPTKRGSKNAAGETPAKSTGKRKSKRAIGDEGSKSEQGGSEESPAKKMKAEAEDDAENEV